MVASTTSNSDIANTFFNSATASAVPCAVSNAAAPHIAFANTSFNKYATAPAASNSAIGSTSFNSDLASATPNSTLANTSFNRAAAPGAITNAWFSNPQVNNPAVGNVSRFSYTQMLTDESFITSSTEQDDQPNNSGELVTYTDLSNQSGTTSLGVGMSYSLQSPLPPQSNEDETSYHATQSTPLSQIRGATFSRPCESCQNLIKENSILKSELEMLKKKVKDSSTGK